MSTARRIISYCLCVFLFLIFLPRHATAAKFGINVAGFYEDIDRAISLVGEEGWLVVALRPNDSSSIATIIQKTQEANINLIIRGHYPGDQLNRQYAIDWVNTLYRLRDSISNKIYFIPVNEPNNPQENVTYEQVDEYLSTLTAELTRSTLRGNKILLLSPALDIFQLADNGLPEPYKSNWTGAFFEQFDGLALHLYGQMVNNAVDNSANPMKRGDIVAVKQTLGIRKDMDVFMDESGVLCVDCTAKPKVVYPYTQQYASLFKNYLTSVSVQQQWTGDRVKMFGILSYSPEETPTPRAWISSSYGAISTNLADFAIVQVGGGVPPVRAQETGGSYEALSSSFEATSDPRFTATDEVLTTHYNTGVPTSQQKEVIEDCGFLRIGCFFGRLIYKSHSANEVLVASQNQSEKEPPSFFGQIVEAITGIFTDVFGSEQNTAGGYANLVIPKGVKSISCAQAQEAGTKVEECHKEIQTAFSPRVLQKGESTQSEVLGTYAQKNTDIKDGQQLVLSSFLNVLPIKSTRYLVYYDKDRGELHALLSEPYDIAHEELLNVLKKNNVDFIYRYMMIDYSH